MLVLIAYVDRFIQTQRPQKEVGRRAEAHGNL